VAVRHCLLALPGVEKGDVRRVLSHPQALAQTDSYTRRMAGVVREAVDDTGGWARGGGEPPLALAWVDG
jgi:arogenate/prephenate dehydratase